MCHYLTRLALAGALGLFLNACSDDSDSRPDLAVDEESVFAVANQCYLVSPDGGASFLAPAFLNFLDASGSGVSGALATPSSVTGDSQVADRILLRPSDLGKYLLYTQAGYYIVAIGDQLWEVEFLESDTRSEGGEVVIEDRKQSEGEWLLEAAPGGRFMLQHILSGNYIDAEGGLSADEPAELELVAAEGCAEFPELTVDAEGEVAVTQFEDGDLFGFVETHSHLFTNQAFGGGGSFHGAPFHPLGVEHALPDCDLVHGEGGRRDFIGFAFGDGLQDLDGLLPLLLTGELTEDDHATAGYPDFTDWPDATVSATHQMQYWTWIERAYLSGLRLLVQHATTNQVLCQLAVGIGAQPLRHDCNDMVAVDRIIEDTYALERYIDAQHGGPGKGWFRIVFSPAEAREQILAGNLAVVLGIETSDLFDCFLIGYGTFEECTPELVVERLDKYWDMGVRVLFPVHKFDNAFSAGDGDRRVSELGNFAHTGHFANFIECPEELLTFPGGFDSGRVNLGGLNMPRAEYDAMPPFDFSGFEADPLGTLLPFGGLLAAGPLEGEWCQNHGLTSLGEFLLDEMMKRGMVIEVDHLPRKGYKRAYEILVENDYPAAGTHGRNYNGLLYELGGISTTGFGRCRGDEPATMDNRFQDRIQLMRDSGAYPAEGFGFDMNGFSSYPRARFGERSRCSTPQTDEGVTYPFTSYAGDVTLTRPVVGNRTLDFNTEGMVHLGLVAEYIEDVRRDGVTDEALEPLFRSAEGYIRMWEKSERRGAELRGG